MSKRDMAGNVETQTKTARCGPVASSRADKWIDDDFEALGGMAPWLCTSMRGLPCAHTEDAPAREP